MAAAALQIVGPNIGLISYLRDASWEIESHITPTSLECFGQWWPHGFRHFRALTANDTLSLVKTLKVKQENDSWTL